MKKSLHTLAAALTMGVLWAVMLFFWTLLATYNGYGAAPLDLVASIYPMYTVSYAGAIWGLIWGFLDFFIATYIVVHVYNFFVKKLGNK
jgi:hypothetical protein